MIRVLWGIVLAASVAMPAAADKIAIVAAVSDYAELQDTPDARRVLEAAEALRDSRGISADVQANPDLRAIRQMTQQLIQMARSSDGQVVVLAGRFANNGVETFFLPADMTSPNVIKLYDEAVPLSLFLGLLTNAPAGGLLVLAPIDAEGPSGPYWSWGLGPLSAPENVAIIHGTARAVTGLVQDILPHPRRTIRSAVNGSSQLRAVGDLPEGAFLADSGIDPSVADNLAWDLASSLNTLEAYNAYLARFPSGRHADAAREKVRALTQPTPEQVEAALNLTREQRRTVQRDLTALGFNTRGVDGIFGPGTRSAIRDWQRREGYEVTGFLTGLQIGRLHRQAEDVRAEERRRDDAYWAQTGALGTEAGYREYLDRYPNGVHADEAKNALARLDSDRRAEERRAWDRARTTDTVASYRQYLDLYPRGEFAEDARRRIAEIERESSDAAARAEEDALNLTNIARLLVERRLSQTGYQPGIIDGNFDLNTRNAIRQFQQDQGLPVSGYLNEATIGRLIAGGVLQLMDR